MAYSIRKTLPPGGLFYSANGGYSGPVADAAKKGGRGKGKKRGRPKGSGKKRGPGRPKGSGKKRGPGRPKGSGKKRGPGRPKGSGKKHGAKAPHLVKGSLAAKRHMAQIRKHKGTAKEHLGPRLERKRGRPRKHDAALASEPWAAPEAKMSDAAFMKYVFGR